MQLNQTIEQLQTADRITGRCLIGTGIVSGFELALDDNHNICVATGKGITSDGKYVELPASQLFSFYRDFDPERNYPLFLHENGERLPVWELITEKNYQDGDQPLSPQYAQEQLNPFLRDKVVLLYLSEEAPPPGDVPEEAEPKKGDAELPEKTEDSPEQGEIPQNFLPAAAATLDATSSYHIRFLLMQREDLLRQLKVQRLATQLVWTRLEDDDDYIYSDFYNPEDDRLRSRDINLALNPALRLPEIPLRRFGFSKGDPLDCPPGGVDQSEFPPLFSLDDIYSGYRPAIDEAIGELDAALRQLYRYFKALLVKYPVWDISETLDLLCDKWDAFKQKNQSSDASRHRKEYIQYFYDWLRDLLAAYHELRNLLIEFTFISIGDASEFPFHLLIGVPLREEAANIPKPFRQHFKQPPIYNGQASRLPAIRLYFWRMLVMIKNFYLPDYIDPPEMERCNTPIEEPEEDLLFQQLKITPGRYYDQLLGLQSMPYYYYPIARHRYSMHHFWSYERTRDSSNDQILSFHANDTEDSYTEQLHAIRPLHYNIDAYPFFRIEGHIGQPLMDYTEEGEIVMGVLNHLHYLKRKYNLDFGIIALPIRQDKPLSHTYKERMPPPDTFQSFHPQHLGMEHLAGVQKGGTFAVIYDEEGKVISDFSSPYRCCHYCISGKVKECVAAEALVGASVTIEDMDNPDQTVTKTTDAEGRFRACLAMGNYRLKIESTGYDSYNQEIPLSGDVILDVSLENQTSALRGSLLIEPALTDDALADATLTVVGHADKVHELVNGLSFTFEELPVDTMIQLELKISALELSFTSEEIEIARCAINRYEWNVQQEGLEGDLTPAAVRTSRPVERAASGPGRSREKLYKVAGKPPAGRKDELSTISGIGPSTEKVLYENGITTFAQLSKMKMDTYGLLDPPLPVSPKAKWANEAAKLAKK